MKYLNIKLLLSLLALALPSYVTANTKSEELHFKALGGIDKAGEMASLGIGNYFRPCIKGLKKL